MIRKLVDSAPILPDLKAKAKEAVLKELLQAAQDAGAFPKKAFAGLLKKLGEREAMGSTGIGNGVAVPHLKSEEVKTLTLVLGRSKRGIEYQAIDGRAAQILFLLAAPQDAAEDHLRCLRWISGLARNADFRRFFLDAEGADAIRDLLREMTPAQ
jgi:PTS system nitrogen regulatory IIA component